MQLREIQRAIHELRVAMRGRAASFGVRLAQRVAMRWLVANQNLQYDIMLRLQILEGVAGIPVRTWWDKGKKGLKLAANHFAEVEGADLNPDWLSEGNTGAYELAAAKLAKLAKGQVSPLDVIHSALFGIPMDPSLPKENLIKLYEVGKHLKQPILDGKETPKKTMAGLGGRFLEQSVIAQLKQLKKLRSLDEGMDEDGEGTSFLEQQEAPELWVNKNELWSFLAKWWLDASDSLGGALRAAMKKSWANWEQGNALSQWLDESVKRGSMLSSSEAARMFNTQPGNWITNYMKPGFARVAGELKKQSRILNEINRRLLALGFTDVDLEFDEDRIPHPKDINPDRLPGGGRPTPKVQLTASDDSIPVPF
jgi:hypothetical protein